MLRNPRPAVLVVEEEVLLRMDAVDEIGATGFRTYEAGSSLEAIRIMEGHPDVFALFTDVGMRGSMDGLSLAAFIRSHWPSVRILIASGSVELKRSDMPDHALFFLKPYAIKKVTDALLAMAHGLWENGEPPPSC